MARRVIVQRIDDLDHRVLAGDGQTVTFSFQGVEYEIDLCADNAKKLTDVLAPFVVATHRVSRR